MKIIIDAEVAETLFAALLVGSKEPVSQTETLIITLVSPEPVREVSLAVHTGFVKEMLIVKLREAILKSIPQHFKKNERYIRVRWD